MLCNVHVGSILLDISKRLSRARTTGGNYFEPRVLYNILCVGKSVLY